MKKIGIDMDEVLAETFKSLLEKEKWVISWIKLKYENIYDSYLPNIPGIEKNEAWRVFENNYFTDFDVLKILPVKYAKNILEILKKIWVEVHIITARSHEFEEYSKKWLEKHFWWLYENMHFAAHYTDKHKEKSEICHELWISHFIEDNHKYCTELSIAGVETFLLNKPWNIHLPDENHKITRLMIGKNYETIY